MPLDMSQRLMATIFFDTQPKRRAAYLKQLGYEMDPNDPNKYKEPGDTEYSHEIDPGGYLDYKQYLKKGGSKELFSDLFEGLTDMLQGTATEAGGQTMGSLAGAGAAIPTAGAGAPFAYAAARGAGRAATYQVIEGIKDKVGDLVLHNNMPPDQALRMTQTVVQAVAPEVVSKGASAIKAGAVKMASGLAEGFKKLAGIGGGRISDTVWNALKKDWKKFTDPSAIKNAEANIEGEMDKLLGTSANSKVPDFNKSVFGQKVNDLDVGRKQAALMLAQNPQASFTTKEALGPLVAKLEELNAIKGASKQTLAQKQWIKDKIAQLSEEFPDGKIRFDQADQLIKEMQSDMYNPESGQVWRDAIRPIVGQMNKAMKDKASSLGSPYAGIKDQESKLFNAFDVMESNVNTKKALKTIVGGADDRALAGETKQVTEAMKVADDALGTNLSSSLKDEQILHQLFKANEKLGTPRGAGGFATGFAVGAAPVAALSTVVHPAAPLIVPAGLAAGALSNPGIAIPAAIGAERASQAIGQVGGKVVGALETPAAGALIGGASRQPMAEATAPTLQQEMDEFDKLGKTPEVKKPSDEEMSAFDKL